MDRVKLAEETVRILEARGYPDVSLGGAIEASIAGTILYRPGELEALPWPEKQATQMEVEVTEESTLAAARRWVEERRRSDAVALNFASARNPGGGWLGAARAQEESIARASALVPSLEAAPLYYAANRQERSLLYTDHLIHSPGVPVFRDDLGALLTRPYCVAFITSPAPNVGALGQNQPERLPLVRPTLVRRTRQVLKAAAVHGHRVLVLGAWGCGAFRGDPHVVAGVFAEVLKEPEVQGQFDWITFAIVGGRPDTLPAFRAVLGPASPVVSPVTG